MRRTRKRMKEAATKKLWTATMKRMMMYRMTKITEEKMSAKSDISNGD